MTSAYMSHELHFDLKNFLPQKKSIIETLFFIWQVSIYMVLIYKNFRFLYFELHNKNHHQLSGDLQSCESWFPLHLSRDDYLSFAELYQT